MAMIKTWQLQEAKNKFSRVVDDAVNSGPQIITKHGVEVAIVISYESYQKMIASRGRLSDFFRESPLVGLDLDLARDKSDARRAIEL
jgi:antitoxin Phd